MAKKSSLGAPSSKMRSPARNDTPSENGWSATRASSTVGSVMDFLHRWLLRCAVTQLARLPPAELLDPIAREAGLRAGPGGRAPRQPGQRGELAEVVTGGVGADHVIRAVGPRPVDLHVTLLDDVHE